MREILSELVKTLSCGILWNIYSFIPFRLVLNIGIINLLPAQCFPILVPNVIWKFMGKTSLAFYIGQSPCFLEKVYIKVKDLILFFSTKMTQRQTWARHVNSVLPTNDFSFKSSHWKFQGTTWHASGITVSRVYTYMTVRGLTYRPYSPWLFLSHRLIRS